MEILRRADMEELGRQQLKYMLLNPDITEDEVRRIRDVFRYMFAGPYVVSCTSSRARLPPAHGGVIRLDSVGPFCVLVLPECAHIRFTEQYLSGFHVGMSGLHSDLEHFRTAFEEAARARKHSFFTGKRLVPFAGAVCAPGATACGPGIDPDKMARQLSAREYGAMARQLEDFFLRASRALVTPEVFETFMQRFFDAVSANDKVLSGGEREKREELRPLYRYDTLAQFRLAFFQWLDALRARLLAEQEGFYNRQKIQDALDYIRENYATGLNMAVVSNHVSMNYSVFSRLFKEYTGQNFVEHLKEIRVGKAKELLSQTAMRISEIAGRVGYGNDKHFMKTFKTAVGVSPTEYRKAERMRD